MSTLIRNIGILDARKATVEQFKEIAKMMNIGSVVIRPELKAEMLKVSMLNIGNILELSDEYKLYVGQTTISRQMLEDAENGVYLCTVGQITVDEDIPLELLKEKLKSIYIIGQISVPQNLHGTLMNAIGKITGQVRIASETSKMIHGEIILSDGYLQSLEDDSELSIMGTVTLTEKIDAGLFKQKIKKLNVIGLITVSSEYETLLRSVLVENATLNVKVVKADYHYLPGGTKLDAFTLMTINKHIISCSGQLFLDEEITSDLIKEKDLTFIASDVVYFPKSVMAEIAKRLGEDTKGAAFEPGKLIIVSGEQIFTNARLEQMPDNCTLVVLGELTIDKTVSIELLSGKIAVLDNYGQIETTKDISSILQSKLRHNEGSMDNDEDECDNDKEDNPYDHIIENAGSYTL